MGFVSSLKAEIDTLEASLRAEPDPRVSKLQELRKVLALYIGTPEPQGVEKSQQKVRVAAELQSRTRPGRKISPERLEAVEATIKILGQKRGPIKTSELFDLISKMGIKLGGTDPQNNYSALLYGRDEFKSCGRDGWVLNDEAPNQFANSFSPPDPKDGDVEREGQFTRGF